MKNDRFFTKDMSVIAWTLVEYGIIDTAVNVDWNGDEPTYSVIHIDSGKALPLHFKPEPKYSYNKGGNDD